MKVLAVLLATATLWSGTVWAHKTEPSLRRSAEFENAVVVPVMERQLAYCRNCPATIDDPDTTGKDRCLTCDVKPRSVCLKDPGPGRKYVGINLVDCHINSDRPKLYVDYACCASPNCEIASCGRRSTRSRDWCRNPSMIYLEVDVNATSVLINTFDKQFEGGNNSSHPACPTRPQRDSGRYCGKDDNFCLTEINLESCLPKEDPVCPPWGNITDVEYPVCKYPNGTVVYPQPTLPYDPDVTYIPGNLDALYDNATLSSNATNLILNFTSNLGSVGPPADDLIEYAAIIYDDDKCQGDILGVAGSPHYSSQYDPSTYTSPYPSFPVFPGTINPSIPQLSIFAHPRDFNSSYYIQSLECSDDNGGTGNDDDWCGLLTVCIEFQALLCGNKIDFVDVKVEIEYGLIEECDDEFCREVVLQRDPVVEDGEDVDIGTLECYPCNRTDDYDVIYREQGESVLACLEVITDTDGICVYEILELSLVVQSSDVKWSRYGIIPSPGLTLVDTPGFPNPNYNPTLDDGDGATVNFLLPGEEFQELYPCEFIDGYGKCICKEGEKCTTFSYFEGKVKLGLGVEACAPPGPGVRRLQDSRIMTATFTGGVFSMDSGLGPVDPPVVEEPAGLFDFFFNFLDAIVWFFTFQWLF